MNAENYMRRCLQLAALGSGSVAPNPMVGALLVYENRIIGEGYHQIYGGPHAEVNCIESVKPEDTGFIAKSTIFVTLEPCVHFGKTPPCTDLITRHGIKKVVVGIKDVFEKVSGLGIERMRSRGIDVQTGVLENECRVLNKRFFTFHQRKRPFIILKWAQTPDAVIGVKNKERLMISNKYVNTLVHKWRSEEAAILVGAGTALADSPLLTTRFWPGKNPLRILMDRNLRIDVENPIFNQDATTWVFNGIKQEDAGNIQYIKVSGEDMLSVLMQQLYEAGVQSVLVEGGKKTLQSFIDAGLWDEARVITGKKHANLPGNLKVSAPDLDCACLMKTHHIMDDYISYFEKTEIG